MKQFFLWHRILVDDYANGNRYRETDKTLFSTCFYEVGKGWDHTHVTSLLFATWWQPQVLGHSQRHL
jgi:hypothetical protein